VWQNTTVGEICTKVFSGGTPTSNNASYYAGGTIPWLRTKEVNYRKIYDTEEHITERGFENSSVKLVPVNSVIVAMYGNGDTAGRVAINKVPLTTNQACCNLVVDASQADYRYVYYYLMGKYKALVDLKNGGAQQNLNGQLIKAFPIELPGIEEQVEISDLLESFDDRITLLRETNATLEAIAQALFKSWFVDFDPVRAKMEGRAPAGMDEATAALFPDSFEETELGAVPRGWRVRPIGEMVDTLGGATPDTKNEAFWVPATHHWTSPKDLSGLNTPVLLDTERRISPAGLAKIGSGLLPVGTLLMSSRAPIGYLALTQVPVAINQGYIAIPPGGLLPPLFMLFWCRHNMDNIKGRANGSTFMEISKKAFRPIPAVEPHSTVVQAFVDVADALFLRLVENEKQAQTLATLRDTLLPRLISGQLLLPEAQAELEAVDAV
jgi:type I restriction enzyme S subunit